MTDESFHSRAGEESHIRVGMLAELGFGMEEHNACEKRPKTANTVVSCKCGAIAGNTKMKAMYYSHHSGTSYGIPIENLGDDITRRRTPAK
jgi:hypothetical protein